MNNTLTTACRPISLWILRGLLSALLFQGCAYPPPQPVHYPPPLPEVETPAPPSQPPPETQPVRKAPATTNAIAADFSRQAAQQAHQGRLEQATATLERGLRVAPKNARLWSQLAEIKLRQKQYQQARSLAAKSNSLAVSDNEVVQKNNWIINESLRRAANQ